MKKILIAICISMLFIASCKSTPEPTITTLAEGSTNLGDIWSVYIADVDSDISQIVYSITSRNYVYNFSIVSQITKGEKLYTFIILEQKGIAYDENYWNTFELEINSETILLTNTVAFALEGERKGLAISGDISKEDITKLANARFVNVIASSTEDEDRTIINTLPIEFQENLLSL